MAAAEPKPASVIAGRIKCSKPPRPLVGSQPSCTAKMKISSSPSQKLGIACPTSANRRASRSGIEPRRSAASIPAGTPTTMIRTKAAMLSCTVAQRRGATSSQAGRSVKIESPKSSRTTSQRKLPYWTISGSSRPSRSRWAWIDSSVALRAAYASIGSPISRAPMKTSVTTTKTTTSDCSTREMRCPVTAAPCPPAPRPHRARYVVCAFRFQSSTEGGWPKYGSHVKRDVPTCVCTSSNR